MVFDKFKPELPPDTTSEKANVLLEKANRFFEDGILHARMLGGEEKLLIACVYSMWALIDILDELKTEQKLHNELITLMNEEE